MMQIEQADREAFICYEVLTQGRLLETGYFDAIRTGAHDQSPMLQLLAKHRLSANQAAPVQASDDDAVERGEGA